MNAPQNYNPYAAPQFAPQAPLPPQWSSGSGVGHTEGALLVLPNGAPLPAICSKCGGHGELQPRPAKFSYIPQWTRVVMVISPLIGIIIAAFVTKRSRFALPLCRPCNEQWKTWTLAAVFGVIGGILLIMVAGALASLVSGIAALIAGIVGLAGLVTVLVLRYRVVVRAAKIDKTHTWLAGMHPDAMRAACGG